MSITWDVEGIREVAQTVDKFAKDLESTCSVAKGLVDAAETVMPFREGLVALAALKNYLNNIMNALPDAGSVEKQLLYSADCFEEGGHILESC